MEYMYSISHVLVNMSPLEGSVMIGAVKKIAQCIPLLISKWSAKMISRLSNSMQRIGEKSSSNKAKISVEK